MFWRYSDITKIYECHKNYIFSKSEKKADNDFEKEVDMQTEIYYGDISRTENLESFLFERLDAACGEFFKYDSDAHLTVRVETERHRTGARKPVYVCEVVLKPTKTRGVIKIRKTDDNFKRAVAMTVASLKSVLRRRSSKKNDHHRWNSNLELINKLMEDQTEEDFSLESISA